MLGALRTQRLQVTLRNSNDSTMGLKHFDETYIDSFRTLRSIYCVDSFYDKKLLFYYFSQKNMDSKRDRGTQISLRWAEGTSMISTLQPLVNSSFSLVKHSIAFPEKKNKLNTRDSC